MALLLGTVGLQTSIWNNNIRSAILLLLYPLIMVAIFWAIAVAIGYFMAYGISPGTTASAALSFGNRSVAEYWPLVLTVVAFWFLISYFFHTRMMRMLSHARPVTRKDEPKLYNLVENLCIAQGMTVPKLEIIETDARNAFASGINEKSFSITLTRGLIDTLKEDELEAVLGHELTHIINRDVRLLIISIIFVGMIGFAAQMVWSSLRYNLFMSSSRNKKSGRLILILIAIAIILGLGYLATMFTRFALSRRREYLADAGSITLTKNPEAMMRALQRIAGADRLPETTGDIAMMCIENSRPFLWFFATHPSIQNRLKIISENTGIPIPQPTRRNPWKN